MKYALNGTWTLYYGKQQSLSTPQEMLEAGLSRIEAAVPGNVELDLIHAGILPAEIYKGENINRLRNYEDYEWWYQTEFETPDGCTGKKTALTFEGVDTLAEYWLNGTCIGTSANMLIPAVFDISSCLKHTGKNTLYVHIASIMKQAYQTETPMLSLMHGWDLNYESVSVRKAAHCFGWDIMPRAVTAGIWRDVTLSAAEPFEISQLFYHVRQCDERKAKLRFCYEINTESVQDMRITIHGVYGNSEFCEERHLRFKAGTADFEIHSPKLWWPYGYGEPNLYETDVTLYQGGTPVASKHLRVGLRSVELLHADAANREKGCFEFHINGVRVMCKGSNWVPMDVFHSRDKERYPRVFPLVKELGCNMLRCWGGNVYEPHEFYDFCDENGIMVWQDFAMACHAYPQDEVFLEAIRREAAAVVKKLRIHPSIVLWAGDNECDIMYYQSNADPGMNRLTREILPQVVYSNDAGRPYLASSPYVSETIFKQRIWESVPEEHLWGPRDYYKSPYYLHNKAHFYSEIGYHGCVCKETLEKFIDQEYLWPSDNHQWILHSTEYRGPDYEGGDARVYLMAKQVRQLFGTVPQNLEDFIFASQISQAEALKFFIENVRIHKETKGGILWWNLIDGWPQFSDAVVDYYFNKKTAFDYIKRAQQPVALMFGEMEDWHLPLTASNDTLQEIRGRYRVRRIDGNAALLEGSFTINPNENTSLGALPMMYSEQGMLLIEWEIDGSRYFNHYLYGYPAFDLAAYKGWFQKLNRL